MKIPKIPLPKNRNQGILALFGAAALIGGVVGISRQVVSGTSIGPEASTVSGASTIEPMPESSSTISVPGVSFSESNLNNGQWNNIQVDPATDIDTNTSLAGVPVSVDSLLITPRYTNGWLFLTPTQNEGYTVMHLVETLGHTIVYTGETITVENKKYEYMSTLYEVESVNSRDKWWVEDQTPYLP